MLLCSKVIKVTPGLKLLLTCELEQMISTFQAFSFMCFNGVILVVSAGRDSAAQRPDNTQL